MQAARSGPSLQKGRGGAARGGGNRFGGGVSRGVKGGEWGDTRSEEADKTGRISGSKTWPRRRPLRLGKGPGRGGQGSGPRGTPLSPPTARLGSRWNPEAGPAVLAPPPRSSLPGHTASARPAGRLRVPPRPTASGAAEPPPVEHAQYLRLLHVGPRRAEPAVAVTWVRAFAAAGSPSRPQSAWKTPPSLSLGLPPSSPDTHLGLSFEVLSGHVATSFPTPQQCFRLVESVSIN